MERDSFDSILSLKKKINALLVFLTSGFIGLIALSNSHLAEIIPASSVLLPLFSGLFASPALILSIAEKSKIPEQLLDSKLPSVKSILAGSLSGSLVALFPGVSSGIATALASAGMGKNEDYIASLSAANTSNALLCFAVFLSTGKIRSGAVYAVSNFSIDVQTLIMAGLITAFVATQLTLLSGIATSRIIPKFDFSAFSSLILIFLTIFIFFSTGWFGLTIFAIATPIGLSTLFLGVRRINCMGSLILPVLLMHLNF
jgi:putative membrane protein